MFSLHWKKHYLDEPTWSDLIFETLSTNSWNGVNNFVEGIFKHVHFLDSPLQDWCLQTNCPKLSQQLKRFLPHSQKLVPTITTFFNLFWNIFYAHLLGLSWKNDRCRAIQGYCNACMPLRLCLGIYLANTSPPLCIW